MSFSNTHQKKLMTNSNENELQNKIENALHDISNLAGQEGVNTVPEEHCAYKQVDEKPSWTSS